MRIISPIRNHRLLIKKHSAEYKTPPFKLLVHGVTETIQTVPNCVTLLGFLSELNNKAVLLNIHFTWVTEHGEIKVEFTLKLLHYSLTFIVPEAAMQTAGEK